MATNYALNNVPQSAALILFTQVMSQWLSRFGAQNVVASDYRTYTLHFDSHSAGKKKCIHCFSKNKNILQLVGEAGVLPAQANVSTMLSLLALNQIDEELPILNIYADSADMRVFVQTALPLNTIEMAELDRLTERMLRRIDEVQSCLVDKALSDDATGMKMQHEQPAHIDPRFSKLITYNSI